MTIQGEKKENTLKNVKTFWDNTTVTSRDFYARDLETATILSYLKSDDKVLDVGCGTGSETIKFAGKVRNITGIDYSENMIIAANKLMESLEIRNAKFLVSNALDLPFGNEEFDVVIGERLLINLSDVNTQVKATREIYRVLKSGGCYFCLEVTIQGHQRVNKFRELFGLKPLEKYWHNNYLDEENFPKSLDYGFTLVEKKSFGMYHFLSKVMHPLLVQPNEPEYLSEFNLVANKIGKKILDFKRCSHQVLYLFRKK